MTPEQRLLLIHFLETEIIEAVLWTEHEWSTHQESAGLKLARALLESYEVTPRRLKKPIDLTDVLENDGKGKNAP